MIGTTLLSNDTKMYLDLADVYAKAKSGCRKVDVGAVIVKNGRIVAFGANRTFPDLCKTLRGCHRVELYGEDAKDHRLPADCRALHSEVDAICNAGVDLQGATIYVTRYPCEACARAIKSAGIKTVYFGRQQPISEETEAILREGEDDSWHGKDVEIHWVKEWDREDTTR